MLHRIVDTAREVADARYAALGVIGADGLLEQFCTWDWTRNQLVDPASPVTDIRPIRVFILDDHELVRRGLIDLLTTTDDLIIVGEAATASDASRRISPACSPSSACNAGRRQRCMEQPCASAQAGSRRGALEGRVGCLGSYDRPSV